MFKKGQKARFNDPFSNGFVEVEIIESGDKMSVISMDGVKFLMSNSELKLIEETIPFSEMMENLKNRVLK